ncbi:MAG: YybH family protein, partial [Pyrinomonadaceae bacterium]
AKGDAAMVAAVFAEDGVQLAGSGKIIKGRQQIMERQKAAMQGADPGVKVSVTTINVWVDGDTAYETGKYKYEYTEKGKPGTDEGQYVTIWKRQNDGSWKLTMDMGVPKS